MDTTQRDIMYVLGVVALVLAVTLGFAMFIAGVVCFYTYNYLGMIVALIALIGSGWLATDIQTWLSEKP